MSTNRKKIECGLLIPVTPAQVGLGIKKQKIGKGKLNGWGGVLDPNETMLECIVREVLEEGGVQVDHRELIKAAVILFHNEMYDCKVHVYLAPWHYPLLQETDEMGAHVWYDRASPPLSNMMVADRDWLPLVLAGKYVKGEVWYGPNQESVQKCELDCVERDEL